MERFGPKAVQSPMHAHVLSKLLLICAITAATASAQTTINRVYPRGAPPWLVAFVPDPNSPEVQQYIADQKTRVAAEREIRKLRARYFRSKRNHELRQAGMLELRKHNNPTLFPSLWDIFENDDPDVRTSILDIFADSRTEEGDAAIAWAAVFDDDDPVRAAARKRLFKRINSMGGEVPIKVQHVIDHGLRQESPTPIAAAASLVQRLKLLDAIPALITAQVSRAGGSPNNDGALGWIAITTQEPFVSDLTPIVGTNSVAFDPEISVVSTGVTLTVIDAIAIIYRTEVHTTLISMTTELWGKDTSYLGWNVPAWKTWYAQEFLPHLETLEENTDESASS